MKSVDPEEHDRLSETDKELKELRVIFYGTALFHIISIFKHVTIKSTKKYLKLNTFSTCLVIHFRLSKWRPQLSATGKVSHFQLFQKKCFFPNKSFLIIFRFFGIFRF